MEQIYVVTKEEPNSVLINGQWMYAAPIILGYAARYDVNSHKCNEKNENQDYWADRNVRSNNGVQTVWGWNYITNRMDNIPYHPKAPLILDNEPTAGFKVEDYATRSSTSNKLWRISDPRGFVLEISTANMLEILTNGGILKGDILDSYKWDFGKQGIGKAKLVKI